MANIDGTLGADHLNGTGGADTISGADSADVILGRGGDDVLYGFGAVDTDPESGTIQVDRIVSGLSESLWAGSPPGEPDKLFVAEQHTGIIKIVDLNTNTVSATPFLDIPNSGLSQGGEQGLLGVAFDPHYARNGKFYVDITNADGDTEIWQYKRSAGDPDVADPASKKLIIRIDQPFDNHNGGWISFGPDGYLYIAMGDGGSGGDPNGNAQNLDSLLGKLLRIDVHGDDFAGDHTKNYAIPADNPFVGIAGADEVWDYGLRNPFRDSFDSATGDLYIADVGQGAHEELDYVAAGTGGGLNFGWNVREGDFAYNGPDDPSFTDPIIDIPHESGPFGGSTIIGGYVYHGPGGGQGLYFFDDVGSNNFWTTRVVDGQATQYVNTADYLRGDVGSLDSIVSWGVDGTGRLYAVGLDGEIFRFTPSAAAGDAGDTMKGGAGNDTIYAGAGDDTLNGGTGDDLLNGGLGSDTASYLGAGVGVTVDLNQAAAQNTGDGLDTLVSIENLAGSTHDDHLIGDGNGNLLSGATGDDTLEGNGGTDTLAGGRGSDTLTGGGSADTFVFSATSDSRPHQADTITDLTNSDTIDLGAVDADTAQDSDQAFTLVASFSHNAGELILVFDGTNTQLKADVDGDGRAELVVNIVGDHTGFDNFVL